MTYTKPRFARKKYQPHIPPNVAALVAGLVWPSRSFASFGETMDVVDAVNAARDGGGA